MFRNVRVITIVTLATAFWVMSLAGHAPAAFAATLGVCPTCQYHTIQDAINAASNGDVITVASGTYAGPIAIDKSVKLVGAGATATIIKGGGPVIIIGHNGAPPEPTVSIIGVTVTGGVNTSILPAQPLGGGILVLPAMSGSTCDVTGLCLGATVTIADSIITDNSAIAKASASCGSGCTFAFPLGGGFDNFGTMTLDNTTVSNNTSANEVTPDATFDGAIGGGIYNSGAATLTLRNSAVTGNNVTVTASTTTNVFGGGGGIYSDGIVVLQGSTISGNSASLNSVNPNTDIFGIGGGMRLTSTASATVRNSMISGNSVTSTGVGGGVNVGANASAGGIDDDGSILLANSTVTNNRVKSIITSASATTSNAAAAGGAMEIDGAATIQNTILTDNSVTSTSPAATENGGASPVGGALATFTNQPVTLTNSIISGNSLIATSATGQVNVSGGGISNCSSAVTLTNTAVNNNTGVANGPSGTAQGGGIWNVDCGGGPPVLTLINSAVTHNKLTANSGVTVQGGGIFTDSPVSLTNSVIARNSPDQCFGC
jgi:fibronectin-binding autotransporter adhesin